VYNYANDLSIGNLVIFKNFLKMLKNKEKLTAKAGEKEMGKRENM
jgi:hypothetical protein